MKKKDFPVTVININKHGEVFDPKNYVVKRAENPELYKFLEDFVRKQRSKNDGRD